MASFAFVAALWVFVQTSASLVTGDNNSVDSPGCFHGNVLLTLGNCSNPGMLKDTSDRLGQQRDTLTDQRELPIVCHNTTARQLFPALSPKYFEALPELACDLARRAHHNLEVLGKRA